jgi:hypothetical protein
MDNRRLQHLVDIDKSLQSNTMCTPSIFDNDYTRKGYYLKVYKSRYVGIYVNEVQPTIELTPSQLYAHLMWGMQMDVNFQYASIIYMERFLKATNIVLSNKNIKNLITVSMIISYKYWCDDAYFPFTVAEITNIDLEQFIKLELEFLEAIKWRLNIME